MSPRIPVGLSCLLAFWSAAAGAGPETAVLEAAVRSEAGWAEVGVREEEGIGEVRLRHKRAGEVDCLEGSAQVSASVGQLLAVAADVPSATRWSRWELVASEVIDRKDGKVIYYQLLDNPAPIADRYWFLESVSTKTETSARFWWRHVDPAQYPEAQAKVLGLRANAIATTVNVGEWRFDQVAAGTQLSYRLCTDAGGNIPKWAGEFAATRTLPANIADVVKEAQRRANK